MQFDAHGGDIYGHAGIKLDFSVNTNALGMPAEVRQALLAAVDSYSRYPDPQCRQLTAAIAAKEGLPPDQVLCGNGAADLIYRLVYGLKPRRALLLAPGFSEYERALRQAGTELAYYRLRAENCFDPGEDLLDLITADLDLLFLCNPNNPTGRLIPEDLLEKILQRAGATGTYVLIDECFLDFSRAESAQSRLTDLPGLFVLKAFTKIYAMAGLRLGYLLNADRALLEQVNRAGQCWSVSLPAQLAGLAALKVAGWEEKTRELLESERGFLTKELLDLGLEVLPSAANFLLLRSDLPLYRLLLDQGILIRSCANFIGLDETYFRLAVKTAEENRRLIAGLKEIIDG